MNLNVCGHIDRDPSHCDCCAEPMCNDCWEKYSGYCSRCVEKWGGKPPAEARIDPRIASVEAQITACKRGATNIITCPFCLAQNKEENPALCCADLGAVVLAILRKGAQQECLDTAARIAEHVAKN